MNPNFSKFFTAATGIETGPFEFQKRLACGERKDRSETEWLASGSACESKLIDIPTGLGKTAAVVLAWLWNRLRSSIHPSASAIRHPEWPRRLVYCLPMRTLVEQTRDNVAAWLKNLSDNASELGFTSPSLQELDWLAENSPIILMGGEEADRDWDVWPEKPAILIGTQDMLISRALNRGYGMSRYRWPMHFGLLNNDALWVLDETQLMGVGVETSAQLDGFQQAGKMPTFGASVTWWMSATLEEDRLATVDHPKPARGWPTLTLSEREVSSGRPKEIITARKHLIPAPLTLNSAGKGGYAKQLAELINERHQRGTLTLVVVNRVHRAREIFQALTTGKKSLYDQDKVGLIHSRFRPCDRERHSKLLFSEGDRIVIATQAVEAGVDVSARLLITELAPWSSLVQRMGRCNRYADLPDAEVIWVDIQPKDEKDDLTVPYEGNEISQARTAIASLTDASPRALRDIKIEPKPVIRPVIRRRDIVDLFDTTPDLCGQDLDISRYIRDGEDNDAQFFWRGVEDNAPTENESPPHRDELCRVSIREAQKFFQRTTTRAWRWNPLAEQWEEAKTARPGVVYLVDVISGGYSDASGWTGEPKDKPTPHPPQYGDLPKYAGDRLTFIRRCQTLAAHTAHVVSEAERLVSDLALEDSIAAALRAAAKWHDVGKAHDEFQNMLRAGDTSRQGAIWAKSAGQGPKCTRHGFRHELASAIAWLLKGPADAHERDLVAYLIAAHHGKVRLSIRSMPDEQGNPDDPDALFARGIWQGDKLPPIPGIIEEPTTLDLSFMKMGEGPRGPSWLARAVALRDRLGPFRLAYLETLLRAADARASRESQLDTKPEGGPAASIGMEMREKPAAYEASGRLTAAEQSLVADLVEDGLSIQDKFRPEPLFKQTGKGHYESGAVEEVRKAKEKSRRGQKT